MKNLILFLSLGLNLLLIAGVFYLVNSLGGFSYMWFKMKNRGVTGVYELRRSTFSVMPKDTGAIVFVGNSLTDNCEWAELLDRPVKNRGITGETSDRLLERLSEITQLKPAHLFLMTGVNDLIFVGPDHVISNYRKILEQIRAESPHTQIHVQSLLPVNNNIRQNNISNQHILEVNQALKTMTMEMGLDYIDLHRLLRDEQGQLAARFTFDGVHLHGDAYLLWKNEILPYLGEALE